MTGIILSGGKNSRITTDKPFLKIKNKFVIELILRKLKKIFEEIIIVVNTTERAKYFIEYFFAQKIDHLLVKTKVVTDIISNKGSLGGLYSGLVNSKTEYNFVVACDMPFINTKLIKYLKDSCDNFDVIIPRHKKGYEPFFAVYSKNCIPYIETQLKQNNLKITNFFSYLKVKEVTEDVIKQFDHKLLSFFNINTDADYQQSLKIKK